jgi:hypothetical protein
VEENGVNEFVWVMEISGAVPTSHFEKGYAVNMQTTIKN